MVTIDTPIASALAALADPTRLHLVQMIARGPIAVGELAADLPVTRPAVSKHLRVLEEAGLVHRRTVGRQRFCELRRQPIVDLGSWLSRLIEIDGEGGNESGEVGKVETRVPSTRQSTTSTDWRCW